MSVAVFTYEARGKKRDEVLQDLGVLSYHVRHDEEFKTPDSWRPNPFQSFLLDQVDAVDRKLQLGEVEEAATLLESAGDVWERWNTQRSAWNNAFANVHRLLAELVEYEKKIQEGPGASDLRVPKEIRFYADLRAALLREYDTAPAKERPAVLVDAVAALGGKEVRYRQVLHDLRTMAGTCERKESCDACLRRLHELWNDLLRLTPNDDLGPFEVRAREVEEAIAACLERPTVKMDLGAAAPRRAEGFGVRHYPEPAGTVEDRASLADLRLRLYEVGSFLVTVLILAGVGFSQLYLSNPTFGSLADYAGLALWGLLVGPFAQALVKKTGLSLHGAD